jgi:hypothetical protein
VVRLDAPDSWPAVAAPLVLNDWLAAEGQPAQAVCFAALSARVVARFCGTSPDHPAFVGEALAGQEVSGGPADWTGSAPVAPVACFSVRCRDPDRVFRCPFDQAAVLPAAPQDAGVELPAEQGAAASAEPHHSGCPSAPADALPADALRGALVPPAEEMAAVLASPWGLAFLCADSVPAPADAQVADAAPGSAPRAVAVQAERVAGWHFQFVHLAVAPVALGLRFAADVRLHSAAALAVAVVQPRSPEPVAAAGGLQVLRFARS